MTAVLEVNPSTVTELIAGTSGVTLVEFTAAWCPPCRALAPVLDQLAGETDELTVVKVDVDAWPAFAAEHDAMSIPTLLFFVEGQPVRRLVGSRGLGSLREELHLVREATGSESRAGRLCSDPHELL
jgi:thioredoxin 1